MTASQQYIDATPLEVIKRRPVGKGAWRMEIREVLESERRSMALLKTIRVLHKDHADTLNLVADALEEANERLIKLNDLYHYKDQNNGNTNGDT